MTDTTFALWFGSAIWLLGGAGLVAALISGATLFAPFALVLILFGLGVTLQGVAWLVAR